MKKGLTLISVLLSIHCSGDDTGENETIRSTAQESLVLWQDSGIESYSYVIEGTGFSADGQRTVTVECGIVVDELEKTLPQLIQDIVDYDGECTVDAAFDEDLGYPISRTDSCFSEGSGYSIEAFQRTDNIDCL